MNAGGQDDSFRGSETPTPPVGLPIDGINPPDNPDAPTPPAGIEGLSDVVGPEDFGTASPTVLGAESSGAAERGEAGEWPTLEYRSKNRPEPGSGALGWLRRRRGSE